LQRTTAGYSGFIWEAASLARDRNDRIRAAAKAKCFPAATGGKDVTKEELLALVQKIASQHAAIAALK